MDHSQYQNFIGIDLGGARGKSTALAKLVRTGHGASVESVLMRAPDGSPWTDDTLLEFFESHSSASTALAINAPLTSPACVRCSLPACPGYARCEDPATVWLREVSSMAEPRVSAWIKPTTPTRTTEAATMTSTRVMARWDW